MNPEVKIKRMYLLMVTFGFLIFLQMGLYVAHQFWDVPIHWNIFQYCVAAISGTTTGEVWIKLIFNLIIIYTLGRIAWRTWKQWTLTRKWLRIFHTQQHTKLMKQLNDKYRDWNTEFIVVQDEAFLALSIGVWKPKIVISTALFNMFNDREIEAILMHERYHCRSRDNLKLFLSTLMVDAFGYMPIIKSVSRHYKTWTELLADRYVVKQMGTGVELSNVLLRLVRHSSMAHHQVTMAYFANTAINYRIMQVLDPEKPIPIPFSLFQPLLLSSAMLLLFGTLLFGGCS